MYPVSVGAVPSAVGTRAPGVDVENHRSHTRRVPMNSDFRNGVSRRSFMRILGAASAAASSFPALAVAQQARRGSGQGGDDMGERMIRPNDAVIISSNENPLGPAKCAMEAIA